MDGNWRGRADVVAATRRNFALLDSQQPEAGALIAQGDSPRHSIERDRRAQINRTALSNTRFQWFTLRPAGTTYKLVLIRRLLVTANTPLTELVRIFAMSLSISFATEPSSVTRPFFTMM